MSVTKPYKPFLLLLLALSLHQLLLAQTEWKPVEGKIMSEWAGKLNSEMPLNVYPRPQMTRENWTNLNGLWNYAVVPVGGFEPDNFDGKILVPYPIESALSGVGKTVGKGNNLWYKTSIKVPKKKKKERLLLHFGAVDWEVEVYVNGLSLGKHRGGYAPFSFDITDKLIGGKKQDLVLKVWDPTDDGANPRGKQVNNPKGIWYTSVTGIWQTVWLEVVPSTYISSVNTLPNIDEKTITINAVVENAQDGDKVKIKTINERQVVAEAEVDAGKEAILTLEDMKLWSPDTPFLYDLEVSLLQKGKVKDVVKSYFGMRKISMAADKDGVQRLMFNNEFLFQFGTLDQGWWPDGLYTAPTDEALKFDIAKTKEMGFNMIRKHVKVEPARWYYHCDKMGMLVWQDMPNGGESPRWLGNPSFEGRDKERSPESEEIYRTEWKEIISDFGFFPSIVVWVPFNEAWGQFKTVEITEWTKKLDPSRLVNSASGGNYFLVGDIMDKHNYPDPLMPRADIFGKDQAIVMGEYGGLGLPVTGHLWQEKDNWGYRSFKSAEALTERYAEYVLELKRLISKGLSGAIYTQTTDVEVEINGLMTYDRKVIKIEPAKLKKINAVLWEE
ncbi:glycoside hydrolase family 2 TIM barrel-domain containing protein [Flammeovirgaceae bacterium SG7u.111]|nr:glycoside hydrolase family 2 TIM barrel-domain containing protein [Flammeovirgaceae bacterium SG7u.132]WPO37595.1 glycoside hydrolase family 2 TIM barrel-domain containing protein [Flammeovirgaceae bacterium SG7u.111]